MFSPQDFVAFWEKTLQFGFRTSQCNYRFFGGCDEIRFKTSLKQFVNMNDPPVQPGSKNAPRFSGEGRPAVPARFMPGMPILKSVEILSDDVLFTRWSRDPYYQYFTGERYSP